MKSLFASFACLLFALAFTIDAIASGPSHLGKSYHFKFDTPDLTMEGIEVDFSTFKHSTDHKRSGSVVSSLSQDTQIEIKLKDMGRLVFYAKGIADHEGELWSEDLGEIKIEYFRGGQFVELDDRPLKKTLLEYHYNIGQYGIDRIVIHFNSSQDGVVASLEKLKVVQLNEQGVAHFKESYERESALKNMNSNLKVQATAVKGMYEEKAEQMFYYLRKIDMCATFKEGDDLGTMRERALNPFSYGGFETFFNDMMKNASAAEKTRLSKMKEEVSSGKWYDIAEGVADGAISIMTGGMFGDLIGTMRGLITDGLIINAETEILQLNGKLYTINKGKLEVVPTGSELEKEYLNIYSKYDAYLDFIGFLRDNAIEDQMHKSQFAATELRIKKLEQQIDDLLKFIIMEADTSIDMSKMYLHGELDSHRYLTQFNEHYAVDVRNVNQMLQKRLKAEFAFQEYEHIKSEFFFLMDEFKTFYDKKYAVNQEKSNAMLALNIDEKIKLEYNDQMIQIQDHYLGCESCSKLKDLTKE